jgi:glycerol-3-phosphate acyltransferase PlsY
MLIALALVTAYVVGSVDFAVVVARMHGVDIRQVGSGNPGTSNVLRTLGRGPAAMVLIGDALKGVIGAAMGMLAAGSTDPTVHWAFAAGLAAVVGHCYPVFHRFKGGRGVATGFGVLLFTIPIVALIDITVWGLLAKFTKVAAAASMAVVVITVPLALWQGVRGLSLVWIALTIALVVWRHRSNISRILRGRESKVTV